MFPNKRMPSGRCAESIIREFKQKLFITWCTEPTTKGSLVKYKAYPMPINYIPFSVWDLWVAIGPPNGEQCDPILKIEFLAPAARQSSTPANGANPLVVPLSISSLAVSHAGMFVSRAAQLKAAHDSKSKTGFVSPTSDTKQEYHSRKHEMSVVNDQIKHLEFIWRSELSTPAQKESAHLAVHQLRLNAISSFNVSVFEVSGRATLPLKTSPQDSRSDSSAAPVLETLSMTPTTPAANFTRREAPAFMTGVKDAQQKLDEKFAGCLADEASAAVTRASFSDQQSIASSQSLARVGAEDSITVSEQATVVPLAPVVEIPTFSQSMGYGLYCQWLKGVYRMKVIPVDSGGMCLFHSALQGIQELKVFSGQNAYKPVPILDILIPTWSAVSASVFKGHILTLMKSMLSAKFEALSSQFFESFEEAILDEGKYYGIVDWLLRDSGDDPARFDSTDIFLN